MHLGTRKSNDGIRFRESVLYTGLFLLLLWGIRITESLLRMDFGKFGIYPRTLKGTLGIILAPLIHNDIYHLISNTFPIAILGIGVVYFYRNVAHYIIGGIYLLSGFWVWVAARNAFHIGASGIVYGLMFFLLVAGFLNFDRKQIAISFIILLLYGGSMFTGLMPLNPEVSWEAHLTGAVAGIFFAVLFGKNGTEKKSEVKEHQDLGDCAINHTGSEKDNLTIEYKEDLKKK